MAKSARTAATRLKEIEAERSSILDAAKNELLAEIKGLIDELNGFGFNYRLTEGGRRGAEGSRKGTPQANPDRACPICNFKTNPPHDARRHRGQENKKPFTNRELEEMGMQKV